MGYQSQFGLLDGVGKEATWSKAIYAYGMAVCLLETGGDARPLMERVPKLRQKIAGKSIPLEKLVARKARKFLSQGHLALPAGDGLSVSCYRACTEANCRDQDAGRSQGLLAEPSKQKQEKDAWILG